MSQLHMPLERLQQQFGAQSGQFTQPFAPTTDWTGQSSLLPLRRPADGIFHRQRYPQNQIGGNIGNFMLGHMPTYGPVAQLIQQLMALLQQLMGTIGGSSQGRPPENFYNDATASSTGDPHLAFNGTQENGQTQNAHFDSMCSHNDLVDSDSFAGGYQVSTQVTTPNANGVTSNQSASVTTNYGTTKVCLDRAGNASITENGQGISIAAGQTLDLGNGQTVTKNNDGSLAVINVNGQGGTINTTLRATGGGVDVTTTAHNADVGGDIVNGQQILPQPIQWENPMRHPMYLA